MNSIKLSKISVAILLAAGFQIPQSVQAQASELDKVTVSASPTQARTIMENSSQIDNLSGAEKVQAESGSLGATLDAIPGVNNLGTGSQTGKPVIRGMSGNRIKVLSNGAATDYQGYGVRHPANIEPYLTDQIEVLRGPQGVLYGADAMGGVVNVLPTPIPYGTEYKGEIAGEINSNNNETLVGAKVGAGSENFGINAGVAIREADNFTVPNVRTGPNGTSNRDPVFVGEVPFTNFNNRSATLGFGYDDAWGHVELRHTYWQAKQNFLGLVPPPPGFTSKPTGQILTNNETQLKSELYLPQGWVLKPSWTHTQNDREAAHDEPFENFAEAREEGHLLDIGVQRDDLKLALEHPKLGDFKGEVGVEWTDKTQTLKSGHLTPSAQVDKRAIYVFEEADYDNWLLQFGARYDVHEVRAPLNDANEHFIENGFFNATNNQKDFEVASGSLGATYRFNPRWSLAANLSRGFRAPTIFELYAGGEHGGVQAFQIGNPDLKDETAINTDLSLRWQGKKSSMNATVYQNTVDNYIYLANTSNYRYTEAAIENDPSLEGEVLTIQEPGTIPEMESRQTDARIKGLELSVKQEFTPKWSADLALELIDGKDTTNNRDLPLIPANNVHLNAHYKPDSFGELRKQKVSLGVKWVDSQQAAGRYEPFSQFDGAPVGTASTDSYSVWNLGYQANIKWQKETLLLTASVDNLFDNDYVDFLNTYKGYTLDRGRNIKVGLRLQF